MLTSQQNNNLTPLLSTPIYGKILIDAKQQWEKENVNPICKMFGVLVSSTLIFEYDNRQKGCCLLGASVIDKPCTNTVDDTIIEIFKITYLDFYGLQLGFDRKPSSIVSGYNEAYKFGLKVHTALWGRC